MISSCTSLSPISRKRFKASDAASQMYLVASALNDTLCFLRHAPSPPPHIRGQSKTTNISTPSGEHSEHCAPGRPLHQELPPLHSRDLSPVKSRGLRSFCSQTPSTNLDTTHVQVLSKFERGWEKGKLPRKCRSRILSVHACLRAEPLPALVQEVGLWCRILFTKRQRGSVFAISQRSSWALRDRHQPSRTKRCCAWRPALRGNARNWQKENNVSIC